MIEFDPDINYYDDRNPSEYQTFSTFNSVDEFFETYSTLSDDRNSLAIFCQNICSFESNLDSFLGLFSNDKMPDIFIFTETWHNEDKPININGFIGYHTVRHGRAGGVSVFVKSQLSSCMIEKFSFSNSSIEICTVKVYNNS